MLFVDTTAFNFIYFTLFCVYCVTTCVQRHFINVTYFMWQIKTGNIKVTNCSILKWTYKRVSHWNRKRQMYLSEIQGFFPLCSVLHSTSVSLPLWRQSRQPRNVLPGYGSLSKLNNTCQESPTHNQLCNTDGSHYVSIFAQPWPRSVYYTIKTHPCFHFAQVLPVYILSCYFLKVEAHYYFVLCTVVTAFWV